MGACILCGKSAGFFYSLHKECFERYQSSDDALVKILDQQLNVSACGQLAQELQSQVAAYRFSDEASQRTLIRALEKFSKDNIENLSDQNYQAWLSLLNELALDESLFINTGFILQQENYALIKSLRKGMLPICNANSANFSVELHNNEHMWWCFSACHVEQLEPKDVQAKWSVFKQIVNNTLPAKKKELFEPNELGEGKIWLTNQSLYYESHGGVNIIDYKKIYACTPIKDGVRLQLNDLQSRPQTFYCEDGRLLFEFIQFAMKK